MPDADEFMRSPAEGDGQAAAAEIATDQPSVARAYAMFLGSKDNFEVDRQYAAAGLAMFPETADIARQNRLFLYRAVRYLARDAGVVQFLDLGSGLPTLNNVHEVAQEFRPDARVVYVDNDPIVSAHGRALLSKNPKTTFVEGDLTDPGSVRSAAAASGLLDLSEPTAVLLFSIGHWVPDDGTLREIVRDWHDALSAGSFMALSHLISEHEQSRETANRFSAENGLALKIRSAADVDEVVEGWETVEPGFVDVNDWRPDPDQPPLPDPHPIIQPYLGASARNQHGCEYGGVLRRR